MLGVVLFSTVACDYVDDTTNQQPLTSTDGGTVTDGGTQTDGGDLPVGCSDTTKNNDETDVDCGGSCATKCGTDKICKIDADCMSVNCENELCKVMPTKFTVQASSNVSGSNTTVYLVSGKGADQFVAPGSADLSKYEICNHTEMINGVSKRGLKIYAQEANGDWWDCQSANKKAENLVFTVNGTTVPPANLQMFQNGQACSGQGPGDLFIPAEVLGAICQ